MMGTLVQRTAELWSVSRDEHRSGRLESGREIAKDVVAGRIDAMGVLEDE